MIDTLPVEIISYILSYLGLYDLLKCKQVCKQLQDMICITDQSSYLIPTMKLAHKIINNPTDDYFVGINYFENIDENLLYNLTSIIIKKTGKITIPEYIWMYIKNYGDIDINNVYNNILYKCVTFQIPLELIKQLIGYFEATEPIKFELDIFYIMNGVLLTMNIDYIKKIFTSYNMIIDKFSVDYVLTTSDINNNWTLMNFVIKMCDEFGLKYSDIAYLYNEYDYKDSQLLRLLHNKIPMDFNDKEMIDELEFVIKNFIPDPEIQRQLKLVAEAKGLTRILEILEK